MLSQREIIENIRKDEFYIGADFNIDSLNRKFNKSLTVISEDLYSDDVHFVLELIQNAEDNKYDSTVNPFLKFIIESDTILIQNNEIGFDKKNILALCSVAESTKTKKEGYIGEKGIGFKSVFRISDEPHIFSNGFQFKFKRVDEELGLGYIVPYWIEDVPNFIDRKLTNILLPLNDQAKEDLLKFSEIEPEILLFLRKLNKVEIQNKVDNIFHSYIKSEENGRIKLSSNGEADYYKVISQELEVPESIKEKTRKIPRTKLVLGFPINQNGSAKIQSEQKVFAFLPTRGYGFKFMIQADFLVLASREDIHKDKKWNEWLRDNISNVFLKSLDNFKKDEILRVSFYNYIPLESEITDELFSKIVGQLKIKLLESNCVFTESAKWLKPSQVFRASEEIRLLISNEDLLKFFGKEFISTLVQENVESKILDFLEIVNFSISHLIELLKNTEWLGKQADEWLIKLYEYLKNKLSTKGINVAKELKIVRLENGVMESPARTIFFPFEKNQVYGFEEQLPFIKSDLAKENKEFLKNLGVLNPQPFEIIDNHILKDFEDSDKSKNWQSKTEAVLIGYINYIKDNLADYERESDRLLNSEKKPWQQKADALERLKKSVRIRYRTEEGIYCGKPDTLYLSKEYNSENNLEFLFSVIDDTRFVHPQYIELSQKEIADNESDQTKRKEKLDYAVESWKKFLITLDVQTKPVIYLKPASQYSYRDTVYHSPIINKIIDEDNLDKNLILLRILDINWSYYRNFIVNTIWYRPGNDGRYNLREKSEVSEWYNKISTTRWLPTKNGGFKEPSKLFLDKSEIRDILGDSVFYLDAEIKNEEFRRALNINSEVKVETVIETLKSLVISKSNNKERFEKLYSFLNEQYQGNELQINKYFRDENLIFIPGISNQYISSGKAIWRDVSEIFGDYRSYLEKYYPKLKDFFVRKIGIPEKPTARNYADILVEISKKDSIEKTDEEKILKIYKELNKFLKAENPKYPSITQEDWWKEFVAKNVFWTNKFNFWRNNNVYVNDDKELYELFKDKSGVAFLKIPQDENITFTPFLWKAGIRYLSKEVKSEIDHSIDFAEAEKLTKQVNELVIYIVRYLYEKRNEIYEAAKQDGRLLQLINLTCYGVEELNVKYTLHTESAYGDNVLFLDGNRLYVKIDNFDRFDNLKDFDRISIEIAKTFGYPEGLSDFIEILFSKSSNEKREKSLITKKIGNLPKDEFEWFIKNAAQMINFETNSSNSDEIEASDEQVQDKQLISENDLANVHTASEFDDQNKPDQNTAKEDTNQTETESPNGTQRTKTTPTNQTEQSQSSPSQNENIVEYDWNPEVSPSEVGASGNEDIIPEYAPSNPPSSRNTQTNSENSSSKKEDIESSKNTLSHKAKSKIGSWGEEFAIEKLREKFLGKYKNCELQETDTGFNILVDNQIKVEVKWLNKYGDYGIGRDIDYIENGKEYFVEVKATKSNSKEVLQISRNEWQLAKDKQENYSIYRIYNSGTKQARAEEIHNPYKEWLQGKLSVQSLTIRI